MSNAFRTPKSPRFGSPVPLADDSPTVPPPPLVLSDPFEGPTERVTETADVRIAIRRVNTVRAALLRATRAWLGVHAEYRELERDCTRAALRGMPQDRAGVAAALEQLNTLSAECDQLKAHYEIAVAALRRVGQAANDQSGVRTRAVSS